MHVLLETVIPLMMLGILIVGYLRIVARIQRKRTRQAAILTVIVGVLVLPWLLNILTIGALFEWYRRTDPYPSWDITLTYRYLLNLVLLYVEAIICLVFWFARRKGASA